MLGTLPNGDNHRRKGESDDEGEGREPEVVARFGRLLLCRLLCGRPVRIGTFGPPPNGQYNGRNPCISWHFTLPDKGNHIPCVARQTRATGCTSNAGKRQRETHS